MITSDDTICSKDADIAQALRDKHPGKATSITNNNSSNDFFQGHKFCKSQMVINQLCYSQQVLPGVTLEYDHMTSEKWSV